MPPAGVEPMIPAMSGVKFGMLLHALTLLLLLPPPFELLSSGTFSPYENDLSHMVTYQIALILRTCGGPG